MNIDFKRIPQNARTIIFERFNDQKDNLCSSLNGCDDADLIDAGNKLLVKSFEDFKKEFNPVVYEVYTQDENGEFQVTYSLEYHDGAQPISLCDHEFYRAIHNIAMKKSSSTTDNDRMSYEELYEALDPKRIYTRARRRRDDVQRYIAKALEAQENGNLDSAKKWMKKVGQTCTAVKNEYSGSALRLLPIAIRDTELLLEAKGISKESEQQIASGAAAPKLLPCSIEWDDDGNLKSVPLKTNTPEVRGIEQKEDKASLISQKYWEKTANDINDSGSFVNKGLFLSVYSKQENTALASLPAEELVARKQNYEAYYVAAQQSFCNAVGYLVQKVASLEQFFMHAGDENGEVENGVIIANCSISDVFESNNNTQNLRRFLKVVNGSEENRIWFAVLSAVDDETFCKKDESAGGSTYIDIFNPDAMSSSASNQEQENDIEETVNIGKISDASSMLSEFGILSFFNFTACDATSFRNFGVSEEIIKEYNEKIKPIKEPNSTVLVYPNFTIIPKSKRQVDMKTSDGKKLYTPDIYIDAAYVAAGIVVATQSKNIQSKKFGKRVNEDLPFISFDLEQEENSRAFATKFNPESRLNMDKDLAVLLSGKNGNAFCFRSDTLEKNAFVFTARTLNARPIYQFITKNYLGFYADRTYPLGMKPSDAKDFENGIYNVTSASQGESNKINPLLHTGETFTYEEAEKTFLLKFNGVEDPIQVDIHIDKNGEV